MEYDELFDSVRLSAKEASDHDGEHAYYETWNQVLIHLSLLTKNKGNIRLSTAPQSCISRKILFDDDGTVDLDEGVCEFLLFDR